MLSNFNMAVSRTFLRLLVFFLFLFLCICGLPKDRVRLKRALTDNDIVLGLKMYESQMSRLQTKIANQLKVINKQKRRIEEIKYYLKQKGDDYEREDLQGEISFQTEKVIKEMQLESLKSLVRETDHHTKEQEGLLRTLKEENKIMSDIKQRVLDNRLICRETETEWSGKASAMIKELSSHYINCKPNELLQRFYMERKVGTLDSKMRYKYRCCRLNMKDNWEAPAGDL